MHCNFTIAQGIYLVQPPYELDLHNNFEFIGLDYSVQNRNLLLHWQRSKGEWVASDTPKALAIEFTDVSEFRFYPRSSGEPFTEDKCINSFGYWTDEDWADGVFVTSATDIISPEWLTAIDFMSGAVIAIKATSAHARIEP